MNLKKLYKRTLSVALASVMVLSMTACGGGNGEQAQSDSKEEKEFVWVSEFIELDSDSSIYNSKARNGYIYYQKYNWDEEKQQSSCSIESISLTDGSAGPSLPIDIMIEGENGSRNVDSFMPTEDGIVTVEGVYHWNEETGESSSEYYVCKYDQTGVRVSEADITEVLTKDENNVWISNMAMDSEGRIYLSSDTVIFLLDAEGSYHGTVSISGGSWIQAIGAGKDGKVYAAFYDGSNFGVVLQEIDYDAKAMGASYKNCLSGNSNGGLTQGLEKDFLVNSNYCLYEYDKEAQECVEVLNWLDCNINSAYINAIYALEDGRIAVVSYDWSANASELALLTKKPASEVQEKIEIKIAGLYTDPNIQSEAVRFNKSNDTYHVSIESYYDYNNLVVNGDESNYEQLVQDAVTRLNNDITSDNCPDMLMLTNVDVERFTAKGVFEDLNTWLDNSTVVKRADYFENILEAFTYDGVLVAVPKSFEINTLVGKASDLGTEPGWTVEEMIAYGKEHSDAELINSLTKDRAIEIMLQYNQGNYVNWETGECNFNNDSFIGILEFANQFPEKYEYNEDDPSEPTKIGNGDLLLSQTYIYDFQSIQMAEAMFGEDACFIGYPNENGYSGTYLQASTGLAMTAKSDCKEGAWAFMESFLTSDNADFSFGFSSKKDDFAKAREEALKVEYLKDENGEVMLDDNGEPIIANGGGSVGYGDDWMYTYHVTTEEEAELLEELIGIAKPMVAADTTILNIIKEEAGAFFKGQRSAADVAGIIQSRVQVYVNENR